MQDNASPGSSMTSVSFSRLSPEDLQSIQALENQLNSERPNKLILIAYDRTGKPS